MVEIGMRILLPEMTYKLEREISPEFTQGTYLTFKSWSSRGASYTLFFEDMSGAKKSMTLNYNNQEQLRILNSFEKYLVGNNPTSKLLIETANPEIHTILKRCKAWFENIPENGEQLIKLVCEARDNASVADGRSGYQGNPYQEIHQNLCSIYSLLMASLSKITSSKKIPNK